MADMPSRTSRPSQPTPQPTPQPSLQRRAFLGSATVLAATLAAPTLSGSAAGASDVRPSQRSAGSDRRIAAIEQTHDRRVGVYARNLRTGATLGHRDNERFAMCSTFKPLAVGAFLAGHTVTPDARRLERRVHYPPSLFPGEIHAPRTREWFARGYAPTMREVCEAAVRDSDNGAINLAIQTIGGPAAATSWLRGIGDTVSRSDRWEPDLSEFDPSDAADTSTPAALGSTYARLVLGTALRRPARDLLTEWLRGNRTDPPFARVLPAGWTLADKTGSGSWATRNDVGVAWTPRGVPILVACLTRADDPDADRLDAPLEDVFTTCVEALA